MSRTAMRELGAYECRVGWPGQKRVGERPSHAPPRGFAARGLQWYRLYSCGKVRRSAYAEGSGVGLEPALIAVRENRRQPGGLILIPEALWPYMAGIERITARYPTLTKGK